MLRRLLVGIVLLSPVAGTVSCAEPPGYAALVRRVAPSVVTVLVEEERVSAADRAAARAERRAVADSDPNSLNSIVRRLLVAPNDDPGRGEEAGHALGSGFVIRADGLIVTNRHVVAGARTTRIRFSDGREVPATLVGADAITDIALLRVKLDHLPTLRLGSSAGVSVGDVVIAIGNPYGLGQSVSAGILSARARTLEDDPYIDFLQTDAAINRGNSGGPLMTADGTVVGVTSAIYSPSGGSVGLGFAIPAETVTAIVRELEAKGHVERGYIGMSGQSVTPELASALHIKTASGTLITSVDPQGPAVGALIIGDVLLTIDKTPATFKDLSKITERLVPGRLVALTVLRAGSQQKIAMRVGRLPEPPSDPALTGGRDVWVAALGMGVADTTVEIRKAIKAADESAGLIVTQLRPAEPGAVAGIKVGDLVTHIGAKQLTGTADIASIDKPTPQEPLLLRVVRDGVPVYVALTGRSSP